MQTETIEITGLPLGTKTALEELVRGRGKSIEDYLRDLIQTDILSERPFSEILEPIRRSFDESGMSEEEPDALFEEARINHLSYQERLWLIERLARRLREDAASQSASHDWQSDIALMAADPQIQAELPAIEQEFAVTEADGLERE